MARAWLGLILAMVALTAGCDREPAPQAPPQLAPTRPAPTRPTAHMEEAPPAGRTAPEQPRLDISGLGEDAAIVAVMKQRVAADRREEQDAFARFRPVEAASLFAAPERLDPNYEEPAEPSAQAEMARMGQQALQQQVPADIQDAIRKGARVKVLVAETCGADTAEALGIPADFDGGAGAYSLDQARFEVALEREGLKPMPLPDDFRDAESDREAVAALNQSLFTLYRSGASKDILVVLDMPHDCGTGEMPVKLVSEPPYKSLRILPELYFTVCSGRGPDPWSPEQCRWWEDVPQDVSMVAGTYYYVATWPDGGEKRGRFTVDEQAADQLGQGEDTLVLDIKQ